MSHGKTMKSPLISLRTSGKRKICAVPVVWSRSFGATNSGFGSGRPVRYGLVFSAVWMAGADAGGATKMMSVLVLAEFHRICLSNF